MSRMLPDWIEGYLEYTKFSEAPYSFRLWSAISAIASALQRKVWLNWGMLTYYPNLYIVLVGPSGARKGTGMTPALKIIRQAGIKIAGNATTREALIQELAQSSVTGGIDNPSIMVHSSLTVFSTELTVFLGYHNKELMSDLCTWYDCEDVYIYRTKTKGVDQIDGVFLNLAGATTPDLIASAMPLEAIGAGLTSRIIFVFEPSRAKRQVFPFMDESLEQKLVQDLSEIRIMQGVYKVSQEFMDTYAEWYVTSKDPFTNPRFEGYCSRRATHLLKLCQVCAASESSDMRLEEKHFKRALGYLEGVERKMEMTFFGVGKSKLADITDKILVYLAANREGVAMSALAQMFYRDADRDALTTIIRTLDMMGQVTVTGHGHEVHIKLKESSDLLHSGMNEGDRTEGG